MSYLARHFRLPLLALAAHAPGCASRAPLRPPALATSPSRADARVGPVLVTAHNSERRRRGLAALAPDPALNAAAQGHAEDMARRRRMSHRGGDGSSPFDRMRQAGYPFTAAAENVAAGQSGVSEVMADWVASRGHRRNLLGAYDAIGTGYATGADGKGYWCVTFGKVETPNSAATPQAVE